MSRPTGRTGTNRDGKGQDEAPPGGQKPRQPAQTGGNRAANSRNATSSNRPVSTTRTTSTTAASYKKTTTIIKLPTNQGSVLATSQPIGPGKRPIPIVNKKTGDKGIAGNLIQGVKQDAGSQIQPAAKSKDTLAGRPLTQIELNRRKRPDAQSSGYGQIKKKVPPEHKEQVPSKASINSLLAKVDCTKKVVNKGLSQYSARVPISSQGGNKVPLEKSETKVTKPPCPATTKQTIPKKSLKEDVLSDCTTHKKKSPIPEVASERTTYKKSPKHNPESEERRRREKEMREEKPTDANEALRAKRPANMQPRLTAAAQRKPGVPLPKTSGAAGKTHPTLSEICMTDVPSATTGDTVQLGGDHVPKDRRLPKKNIPPSRNAKPQDFSMPSTSAIGMSGAAAVAGPVATGTGHGEPGSSRRRSLAIKNFINLDGSSCYANVIMQCLLMFDALRGTLKKFEKNDMKSLHNLTHEYLSDSPYRLNVIPLRMEIGGVFAGNEHEDAGDFLFALASKSEKVLLQIGHKRVQVVTCPRNHVYNNVPYATQAGEQTSLLMNFPNLNREHQKVSIQDLVRLAYNPTCNEISCTTCGCFGGKSKLVISETRNIFVLIINLMNPAGVRLHPEITGVPQFRMELCGGTYEPMGAIFHVEKINKYGDEYAHFINYLKRGDSWLVADDDKTQLSVAAWPAKCLDLNYLFMGRTHQCKAPKRPASSKELRKGNKETLFNMTARTPTSLPGKYYDNRLDGVPDDQLLTRGVSEFVDDVISAGDTFKLKWKSDVFHDIILPHDLIQTFIELSKNANGDYEEIIGKLFGYALSSIGIMVVTHLLIPKQRTFTLTCDIDNIITSGTTKWSSNDSWDDQFGVGKMQVGFIRSQPELLMPEMSVSDAHRQADLQRVQKDAIAIMCANLCSDPKTDIYSLREFGMKRVLHCRKEWRSVLHTHPANIFKRAQNVYFSQAIQLTIADWRG